jgi:putative ABC transport system permease protein
LGVTRRRPTSSLELGRELRFALRSLCRVPAFSLVTIVSLGVGLALATTTLAITNAYLLRSLPYPDGKRLHHVMYAPPGPYEPRGMTAIDWNGLNDVVDATVISGGESYFVGEAGSMQYVRAMRASPGFIRGLGVRPERGQVFAESDYKPGGPEVALIGHALWRTRFNADPNVVGKVILTTPEARGSGPVSIRIIGVLPPGFWFGRTSGVPVEMIVPLRVPARAYMVRLHEGVPVAYAEQRITEAARRVGSDFRPDWTGVHLESAHERYVKELRPLLFGINAASVLVFLLVCANVAILMLLRALRRQKDVAVRIALGAGPGHLLRMLIAEAFLVCMAALTLGVALTALALRTLGPVIESRLGRPPPGGPSAINVDANVVLMIGGIGLVVALSLASVPLLASRRGQLADMLRGSGLGATDKPAMRRVRSTLIALEVAGAVVLLTSGGLMIRSVLNLVRTDLGFDAEHVVRMGITLSATYREPAAQTQFFQKLGERLAAASPASALGSSFPPFYETHKRRFEYDATTGTDMTMGGLTVGAGYFSVHGIELRQGREFSLRDTFEAEPVAVVSESLARNLWPGASAIGRRLRGVEVSEPDAPMGPWRRVVGVARDVRQTYGDGDLRDVYFPFLQSPTRFGSVQLRTDRTGAVSPTNLATIVAELDPFVRVGEPRTLASEDQQYARARFMTALVGGLAAFATLLALLGIYGVTAYAARQREREIAIRVALGATNARVVRLFLREGGRVIGGGVVMGLVATLAAGRIIESHIHGVRPFDLATLTVAGVFLAACGLLTTWWPVRCAASADVVAALKAE